MKSIKKVFICTLAAITMAAPISVFAGADIGNTNYYGTYTCPES